MDVDAYLRRIEYNGARSPDAASLRRLHRCHLFTVPFENLDIVLGTPIVLDVDVIFDKLITRHRGGFCYELNSLFCALLRALGFRVEMLSARVRREDGGFGPEFDHMLLKVELDEPWLVDVGFGDSFVDPIVFHAGGADQVNGHRYSVAPVDGGWQLVRDDAKGHMPLYAFRDEPHELSEYRDMCTFHQKSAESHFTRSWICSRATPDGRVTIANMCLIETRGSERTERELHSEQELRRCLDELLGVRLNGSADLSKLVKSAASRET